MGVRKFSYISMLDAADPDWRSDRRKQLAYQFSNGQTYYRYAKDIFVGKRLRTGNTSLTADTARFSADQTNYTEEQEQNDY